MNLPFAQPETATGASPVDLGVLPALMVLLTGLQSLPEDQIEAAVQRGLQAEGPYFIEVMTSLQVTLPQPA